MYFDLYWFNGGEYFTEYSSGVVYPYFSILKSKPSFLFVYYLFISSTYLLIYYCYYLIITIIIILLYDDGSKAPTRLSGSWRSCLAFVRSGMFGLGMVPKEKLSRLFNPVSIWESDLYLETWLWSPLICKEKAPFGSGYTGLRERIQFNLYVCF